MEFISFIYNIQLLQAVFLIAGLGLVIFEMFHPGFGAPGILGTAFLILGVFLTAKSIAQAISMIIIIIAILVAVIAFVLRSATEGRLSRTLVLHESQNKGDGYIGTEDLEYFVGKEGIVCTDLRPSGTAEFDGVRLDVVSEGEFIPKDTEVMVVKAQGRRIVVKEIKKD